MANENAKIDDNNERTILAVTDDVNAEIRRLLVDSSTGRLKVSAVIATGTITSINGDSTAVQTLTVGTAGSDFNIVDDAAGDHAFNLPTASATKRGALSTADWSTFNSKESALTFSTGLTRTVNTITTNDSEIDHDALNNFVANEHIDWTNASQDLDTSGGILAGPATDTFDIGFSQRRGGVTIGSLDNSGGNFRVKAQNSNSLQLINDGNKGLEVNDDDSIDLVVGSETLSSALQGKVDHANIQNIGTNTHAQIDTKIANLEEVVNNASASAPASIDLHEDTDNGTNKITLKGADSVSSDRTQSLPDADGTIALLETVYPIGSVYINANVSTNPATLLGFGTWVAWGVGKAIVGIDTGDADFDTAEETGGAKTHTLTEAELASHSHGGNGIFLTINAGDSPISLAGASSGTYYLENTDNTGSGNAHNNLQPYQVGYVWKRTA